MHHKETVRSTYFDELDTESQVAQAFVDNFRERQDISSPREWMTYIDVLMGLYKGHEIETPTDDLVVLEMVPLLPNSNYRGINIARRYIPSYKSGSIMAYFKIERAGYEPTRAAVVAGNHPDDELTIKKVLKRGRDRYLCPSIKYPDIFISDIDSALKQSGLPIELLEANA